MTKATANANNIALPYPLAGANAGGGAMALTTFVSYKDFQRWAGDDTRWGSWDWTSRETVALSGYRHPRVRCGQARRARWWR